MTTRRSRLKAVANLPVRRNVVVFQDATDSVSNEKPVACELSQCEETDIKTANPGHMESHEKNISLYSHKDHISDCKIDNNNDKKNNLATNDKTENKISNSSEIVLNICEPKGVSIKHENENENKESLNGSKATIKNKTFKHKKKVQPNLNSSRSKENLISDWSTKTDDKLTPLIGTFINSLLVNECPISVNEASNSDVQKTSSLSSVDDTLSTNLINNTPINVIAVSSLNNNNNTQEDDLVQTKKLINNLQEPVCNQANTNCEIILSQEVTEPIITSLVNCNKDNNSSFNNAIDCHETELLLTTANDTQELCIDDTCTDAAVIEIINYSDNNLARNVVNSVGEKDILDNLIYQEGQNIIVQNSSSDNSISICKKNIAATAKKKRSKGCNFTKKLADARREFQKKYDKSKPDRSTLKMIDLIFYNPSSNPMESKSKFEKKELSSQQEIIQEICTEEDIDEPQPIHYDSDLQSDDVIREKQRMPVPQVKIGLNGEIILDEKSVIIETTEAKKGREDLLKNSIPVFEDRESKVSYYRRKTRKTKDWNDFETKRFYKALNTIGPDFSLMQKYFPKRSRMELKNKFKREERLNRSLIDKALINPSEFDMTQLEKDLAVEKKAEEEQLEMKLTKGLKDKNVPKRSRTKSSVFSREIAEINKKYNNQATSNNFNDRGLYRNENEKKDKEIGQILRKYLLRENKKDSINKFNISISDSN